MKIRGVLLALILAVASGCVAPVSPAPRVAVADLPAAEAARQVANQRVFDFAWSLVNRRYFDPAFHGTDWEQAAREFGPAAAQAPDDRALYGTLNEMLRSLDDDHTRAFTASETRERTTDRRVRTGFTQALVEGRWVVTAVLPGSPAAEAGVQVGWTVVSRNDVPMAAGLDLRAAEGEVVRWVFLDAGERPVALALRARLLSIAPVRVVRDLPGGGVYLRFDRFDLPEWWWVHRQLRAHRDAPGLVLDLRHNGGGHTLALSLLLGEFFGPHLTHGRFIRRSGWQSANAALRLGLSRYRGHLAVLVGAGTASAAEIFSSAVQEQRRGIVVGQRTAGAVLGSIYTTLPDGGQVQVSISDYLTPSGCRLEKNGVEPDHPFSPGFADLRAARDPAVDFAWELLRTIPVRALDASTASPK